MKKELKKTKKAQPANELSFLKLQVLKNNKFLKFGLIPSFFYFLFFSIYTWPWMAHFNTRYFTDTGDGFQNVWNIWWINKAITELQQSPLSTDFLHYPYGTTLIGQTLNPFNGLVAVPLLKFFNLLQSHNILIIFSFIVGGLSMFWLCYFFTRRYTASLIGGFIWTFSSYHLAHAVGHMQLVSLEWIPLFILLWWRLLEKPRYRTAFGASITLFLVLLCDYYYFLYSVALALMIFIYLWRCKRIPPLKLKQTFRPMLAFIVSSAIIILPLPVMLTLSNIKDPLQGSHPTLIYSTDIFSPFINGGFWRFNSLTNWYWHNIRAGVVEGTVYLSLSVITLMIIGLWKRVKIHKDLMFWIIVAVIFGIFSLGPRISVAGITINHGYLPYALLEKLIPPLKLSGVPIRMMVMTIFASAVISAMVLAKLNLRTNKHKLVLGLFFTVLVIELWPSVLPVNIPTYPKYVDALKNLPPTGGVLDNGAPSESWQLFNQTITEKPILLGYISRTPESVVRQDTKLIEMIGRGEYEKLCSLYKVRYYTTPAYRPLVNTSFPVLYDDGQHLIYDLKNSTEC